MQGSAAAFGFLAASADSGGGTVGRAGEGGGCLACLVFFWGGGWVAHRALQGPHLLGWGPAKARAGLSSCREPAGRFSV